jgi:ring-1,2-phenylacetyl-CoA epoxidase subunit PaaD
MLRDRVMAVLEGVPDPEIPVVSVVDLGIVREFREDPPSVIITPTYTGCPATQVIESSIRKALDTAELQQVNIETSISPAWTTDWISESGLKKLHDYGIAPPKRSSDLNQNEVTCPQCGSTDTKEVSRFGSTPCKALWQCESCKEPFERFKCH